MCAPLTKQVWKRNIKLKFIIGGALFITKYVI